MGDRDRPRRADGLAAFFRLVVFLTLGDAPRRLDAARFFEADRRFKMAPTFFFNGVIADENAFINRRGEDIFLLLVGFLAGIVSMISLYFLSVLYKKKFFLLPDPSSASRRALRPAVADRDDDRHRPEPLRQTDGLPHTVRVASPHHKPVQ